MSVQSFERQGRRRHNTSMIYSRSSGRVLHISHVDVMGDFVPSEQILSTVERDLLDHTCRAHGTERDDLAIISLEPKEFRTDMVYSVEVETGRLRATPITTTRHPVRRDR